MSLTPCPHCGLPRVADDADRPCPVCGRRASDAGPAFAPANPLDAPMPDVPVALVPSAPGREPGVVRNRVIVAGTALAAAGVFAVLLWEPWAKRPTRDPYLEPVVANAGPVLTTPTAPAVTTTATPDPTRVNPFTGGVLPSAATPPPEPELAPMPREYVPFAELRLDRPSEEFRLPRLGEGNRVRLVGAVRTLVVDGVGGGAVLDASGLTARDVSLAGKIDGGATVSVRTDGGSVNVREAVGDGATLTIDAGAGSVSFPNAGSSSKTGSAIGGGARVRIGAKTVKLVGPVTGADTHVVVTLPTGGALTVHRLEGPAKLHFRYADPTSKLPRVELRDNRGMGEFKAVE